MAKCDSLPKTSGYSIVKLCVATVSYFISIGHAQSSMEAKLGDLSHIQWS